MSRYQTSKRRWLIAAILLAALPILIGTALFLQTRDQRDKALERLGEIESVAMYEDLWRAELGEQVDPPSEYKLASSRFTLQEAQDHVADIKTLRDDWRYWVDDIRAEYHQRFVEVATPTGADYLWLEDALVPTRQFHDRLVAASERPGPAYALEVHTGQEMQLPHLAEIRGLGHFLSAYARLQAYHGDYRKAAESIAAAAGLGDQLAMEPLVISQLVRITITGIAYETVVDLMPAAGLPEDARATLLNIPSPERFRAIFADAVRYEGIMAHRSMVAIRRDTASFDTLYGAVNNDWGERMFRQIYASPIGAPLANRDEYQMLSILGELADAIDDPKFEYPTTYQRLAVRLQGLPPQYRTTHQTASGILRSPEVMLRAEIMIQLIKWGLLIEAYYDAHGQWPESLDQIDAPPGLSKDDPFSDEPLRYRVDGEMFRLYSVGPNKTDEGGIQHRHQGDWVWRRFENESLPDGVRAVQ